MAKNFEKLIFGGLHEKHAVQRGIWVPTQHLLWDRGKPRKTLIELALQEHNGKGRRRGLLTPPQKTGLHNVKLCGETMLCGRAGGMGEVVPKFPALLPVDGDKRTHSKFRAPAT
jgi:hypothetical protein